MRVRGMRVFEAASLALPTVACAFAFLCAVPLTEALPSSGGGGSPRPLHIYFHYVDPPVYVAGSYSHYTMNTTRLFQAQNNSLYKPAEQPKILVDFYLYPNLAGPLTVNGTWQVFLWANGSALKPCTWNVRFYEINPGGTIIWDRSLSPNVVGGPIGAPDNLAVQVNCYNLSASPEPHEFSAGNTIAVEVTMTTGTVLSCQVWYDSASYPSKVILPCQDYARPYTVKTYDANYTETNTFSVFWGESQRKVVVRANVTDPLGGYDVYLVNVTVLDPANRSVLEGVNMTRVSDGLWATRYSVLYEANWSYPETAPSGNYTVEVSVIDNNGYYHYLDYQTFEPYTARGLHTFGFGVQYPVQVRAVDAHGEILADARVCAVSAGVALAGGFTNASGWWETPLWAGYYNVTVQWQGVEVARELREITGPLNFTLECDVYYPAFRVVDDVGAVLPEAQVYVGSPNGTTNVLPLYTTAEGLINLTKAPAGNYTLTVLWKGVTVQRANQTVDSDGPYPVRCQVYQLTAQVSGNNGAPVQGAYLVVYTEAGIVYDFKMTNASGQAAFKLPVGTYRVEAHHSTVYWLTAITAEAAEPSVAVTSSIPITITLADFPPPIWKTTGFWLLLGFIIVAAIGAVVYLLYKRRR